MGKYINKMPDGRRLPDFGKLSMLITIPGAIIIPKPTSMMENLVCVVENDGFQAALFVSNKREFEIASDESQDDRLHTWMIVPGAADLVSKYEP